MANRWWKCGNCQISFSWVLVSIQTVTAATKLKDTCSLEEELCQTQCFKKQRYHFADKDPHSQSYGFSSSCVQMWELDHEEGWVPKNWCFWIFMLEKSPESPWDSKEIQPVNPKRNHPLIFIGRTAAEAEAPILWPPDEKSWFIRKDPDAGKDWSQEEKGMTEDEMVGRYHWLNGHEFEQTQEDNDGERSLTCYGPWGLKESDTTLCNWTMRHFIWMESYSICPFVFVLFHFTCFQKSPIW